MDVEISEQHPTNFAEYAKVPIAFEVSTVLDVAEGQGVGKFVLEERQLTPPYIKDYDAIEGQQRQQWSQRFDVSNWAVFKAQVAGLHVGGAVVACDTPDLMVAERRDDLAVLWDIRVSPEARGQGVGTALLGAAEAWAKARGCKQMKAETQNINVLACRLYAAQGFLLTTVHRDAYLELPNEIQLLWYKDLNVGRGTRLGKP